MYNIFAFIEKLQQRPPHERHRLALVSSLTLTALIVMALFPFLGTPPGTRPSTAVAGVSKAMSPLEDLKRDMSAIWTQVREINSTAASFMSGMASSTSSTTVVLPSVLDEATTTQAVIVRGDEATTTAGF